MVLIKCIFYIICHETIINVRELAKTLVFKESISPPVSVCMKCKELQRMQRINHPVPGSQKDLLTLLSYKKQHAPIPKCHTVLKTFPVIRSNPHLSDAELEVVVVRCTNVPMPSGEGWVNMSFFWGLSLGVSRVFWVSFLGGSSGFLGLLFFLGGFLEFLGFGLLGGFSAVSWAKGKSP